MAISSSKILLILLFVPLLMVLQSFADDAQDAISYNKDLRSFEVYDSKNYMSGNWGGLRSRLNELGITPIVRYYTTILGNPVGGEKKEFNMQDC